MHHRQKHSTHNKENVRWISTSMFPILFCLSTSPTKSIIHHNYNNKTQCFNKQEPETAQQNSFKDKTINYCKHATPLYKADILRVTLNTLSMDTKQSVNFLEDCFLPS